MDWNLSPATVELLQAFLAFAKVPNVSLSSKELGISRPTMLRRLKKLEEMCAQPLVMRVRHSSYELTDFGAAFRIEAEAWLRQGANLVSGQGGMLSGLLHSSPEIHGEPFHIQQHPLHNVWSHSSDLIAKMLDCWTQARGWLQADSFLPVREHAIVARAFNNEFLLISIGEKAPMMEWLGREWCESSIGKPLSSTVISSAADRVITHSYLQCLRFGTPWYDHVSIELPSPTLGGAQRTNYRRLVMPCKLPDGSPVIASVVELSDDLVIDGFEVPRTSQTNKGASGA